MLLDLDRERRAVATVVSSTWSLLTGAMLEVYSEKHASAPCSKLMIRGAEASTNMNPIRATAAGFDKGIIVIPWKVFKDISINMSEKARGANPAAPCLPMESP